MGERFISVPNLPDNAVKAVLIGEKYAGILGKILEVQGISVISVPDNPSVGKQISSHADLSVCHVGGNRIIAAESIFDKFRQSAPKEVEIIKAVKSQKDVYPDDIGLNVCMIGERLFHNLKYTDPAVLSEAKLKNYDTFNVRQGYAKCSVCVLTNDRIITSDAGIHGIAVKAGIKSLLIQSGSIALEGYDTGLIGGCCGKLAGNRIAFTGRLEGHPDKERILSFINEAGIDIIYLTDMPIFDVGSIIPIAESV